MTEPLLHTDQTEDELLPIVRLNRDLRQAMETLRTDEVRYLEKSVTSCLNSSVRTLISPVASFSARKCC